jgi:hypothetical protein
MINSDNVLLLRTVQAERLWEQRRGAADAVSGASGVVICTTCHLKPGGDAEFAAFFLAAMKPELERCGPVEIVGTFTSERSANTFPRLPVREGETVFVWLARHSDLAAYATHVGRLAGSETWTKEVLPEIRRRTWRENHVARLAPTTRSVLR